MGFFNWAAPLVRRYGDCEALTRGSYRFLGAVAKSEPAA